jgi:abortive infection bacteriophage resistance protein
MKYLKPPVPILEQIEMLKKRGLIFNDETKTAHYLSNISYYRLRAYTYPFQDNKDKNHPFIEEVSFEKIIDLYVFDRHLRLLIFDGLEKIEIVLRTQIIYNFALTYGGFWHLKPELYKDAMRFANQLDSLQKEVDRSNETFIDHYKSKYTQPSEPPCWMSLEVSSMGLLSKIFQNLRKSEEKKKVTKHFGLTNPEILENWMHCFCNLRNICAHHGRIWNRRLVPIKLPYNTLYPFLDNDKLYTNKLYATLCCIEYVLQIISPNNTFKIRLKELIKKCPMKQEKEMGFPANWQNDKLWL